MTFKEDVDLWIQNLERIKKTLPTMAFDKDWASQSFLHGTKKFTS
jgi:hypothetical protein